jgi:hypothetical protein
MFTAGLHLYLTASRYAKLLGMLHIVWVHPALLHGPMRVLRLKPFLGTVVIRMHEISGSDVYECIVATRLCWCISCIPQHYIGTPRVPTKRGLHLNGRKKVCVPNQPYFFHTNWCNKKPVGCSEGTKCTLICFFWYLSLRN